MMLFHSILENFIVPNALYGDQNTPIDVQLYVVGSNSECPVIPYHYNSLGTDSEFFYDELFDMQEWLDQGYIFSFWSDSPIIPGTLDIGRDRTGIYVECTILYSSDCVVEEGVIDALKYERPDLYAKVVKFINNEFGGF